MRHLHFSFYHKYATIITVCVIAVSKSQDFLLKIRRLSLFFRRRRTLLHELLYSMSLRFNVIGNDTTV